MSLDLKGLGEELRALFATRGYTCDCCGKEIFNYPNPRLCGDCESLIEKNEDKTCPKCGRKLVSKGVCLTCKREKPLFKRGLSPFVYTGLAASMINRLKNGERHLAWFFAENMSEILLKSEEYSSDMLVVCVPMTEEKRLERGYNQSEELAKIVAKRLGLEVDCEVLRKQRTTSEQKQLTRKERKENLQGAFFAHKRKYITDRRIVLVDDIMTTGSTGNECSRVLYNAGAKEVVFLTALSLVEQK